MNKFLIIILLFLLSIGIRFENLNRVLDFNGYITAHTLMTLKTWRAAGIGQYHFSPVYTFPNDSDRNISNLGGIKDAFGNYYYISYPPLAFIFPHLIFQLLRTEPGIIGLYVINLFIHFISSYIIYLILSLIFPVNPDKRLNKYAFTGFIIYLFSSGNLWFHQNLYFVDTFVQVFFVISTYLVMKILFDKKINTKLYFVLFFIFSFFMSYSEWIGFLFSLSVILIALFNRKDKIQRKIAVLSGTASFLAIFLTLYQYSKIAGVSEMLAGMWQKYQDRSTLLFFSTKTYLNIIYFYYINYLPTFVFLFAALFLIFKKRLIAVGLNNKTQHLLYLSLFPVILHYLAFFNFNSNHTFSVLKTSFFLTVVTSLSTGYIMQSVSKNKFQIAKYIMYVCIFISISLFYYYFRFQDRLKDFSYKSLGSDIKNQAGENEVVYVCGYPGGFIEPQILYYAGRNIKYCRDIDSLKDKLNRESNGKAIIFLVNDQRKVKKSLKISR